MSDYIVVILAGIAFGAMGSMHCLGMCGPLILALPNQSNSTAQHVFHSIIYHLGRATTYAVFGIFSGIISQSFELVGFQQVISIIAGVLVLLFAFRSNILQFHFLDKFNSNISNFFSKKIKTTQYANHHFALGLLNGFLPCGLVYIALATSLVYSSIYKSILFMFVFGLGNAPVLIALALLRYKVQAPFRQKINKSLFYISVVMGVLLILRGANLGIPLISPKLAQQEEKCSIECCHKK